MRKSSSKKLTKSANTASQPEAVAIPPVVPVIVEATTPLVTPVTEPLAKVAESPAPASAPVVEKTTKTKPAAKEVKEKKVAQKKPKLVRDSFTFPEDDYAQIATLKQRALNGGREVKKTEVLRAALALLSGLSDADLLKALDGIDKLKTGRPAK